jgi:hypothetical protein
VNRRIAAVLSRLRGESTDGLFIAGMLLIVGAFATVSIFAGLLVAGIALVGLAILLDAEGEG